MKGPSAAHIGDDAEPYSHPDAPPKADARDSVFAIASRRSHRRAQAQRIRFRRRYPCSVPLRDTQSSSSAVERMLRRRDKTRSASPLRGGTRSPLRPPRRISARLRRFCEPVPSIMQWSCLRP
ncbi:hypothetical protein C7S16_5752 [Burkholderia thailandensis]|uniref:Uncharacterized protein n=1 Tax=Burkholderia thailandensis TaxID=57975 RepID=A0AAW9CSX7_BURTH|nr:hypothetical protein [Burkholderia thailandensis]MDW9251927.1 hypothetical protein [Burkholderia thailandensis]